MSSILTNTSAMSALQNLATTQKSLNTTQSQISSGLRVASASDNAAYWSIATTMKSDTGALSAVTDALNLGASVVSTATAALNSTISLLNKVKDDVITAQTSGTDPVQVQTDISAQQASLKNIMSSASFNGVNLLDGSTATANVVSSFSRNSSGSTVGILKIDTTNIALSSDTAAGGLLGAAVSGVTSVGGTAGVSGASGGSFDASSILGFQLSGTTSSTDLQLMSAAIDDAIKSVTSASAQLGNYATNITNQSSFVSSLSDAITSGVGSLVDADMNVASTRLQALQTQQQLGIQSLSIANQNSQLILKLFGG